MPNDLYYLGANHTVDLVIMSAKTCEILLIERGGEIGHGMLALPGGFVDSSAKRGRFFTPDKESWAEAAKREMLEEVNLDVPKSLLFPLPSRQGPLPDGSPRDPRDKDGSYTVTHPFLVILEHDQFKNAKRGDDAAEVMAVSPAKIDDLTLFSDHKIHIANAFGAAEKLLQKMEPVLLAARSNSTKRAGRSSDKSDDQQQM